MGRKRLVFTVPTIAPLIWRTWVRRPSFRFTPRLGKDAPDAMSGPEICVIFQSTSEADERSAIKLTPVATALPSRIVPRRVRGSYQLTESECTNFASSRKSPTLYSNFGNTVMVFPIFELPMDSAVTFAPGALEVKLTRGSVPITVLRAPVLKVTFRGIIHKSA